MSEETSREEGFYPVRLTQQKTENGPDRWTAEHPDLMGCHVVRGDPHEAVRELATVREQWLDHAKNHGVDFPGPKADFTYFLVLDTDHTPSDAEKAEAALHTAATEIPTFRF